MHSEQQAESRQAQIGTLTDIGAWCPFHSCCTDIGDPVISATCLELPRAGTQREAR
jgi:hypothetical protein